LADIYTATGARIYIAPSVATPPANAAAYAALTWTEIMMVESIGAYGDESAVITAAVLADGRMRKAKGARDAGNSELVVFPLETDPGQIALHAAEGTYNQYPIKVEKPNKLTEGGVNGIDYWVALVASERYEIGANDNVVRERFNLAVTSAVTRVAAT
jgi:hypothetical protein